MNVLEKIRFRLFWALYGKRVWRAEDEYNRLRDRYLWGGPMFECPSEDEADDAAWDAMVQAAEDGDRDARALVIAHARGWW